MSLAQPLQKRGVLGYATSISPTSLLQATNSQRQRSGTQDLQLNSALSAAAQAKADDMVTRNYWSHTTPDGQQPWSFLESSGYKYEKAGENLAYGFVTSNDAVNGWMNSSTHRTNLLDVNYTEVGFGYANSTDYNKSGEETVVVAMYGKPLVLGATNQQETTLSPLLGTIESASKPVARIQLLTNGNAPWALFGAGLITGLAVMVLLVKHAAGLRHLLRDSERFVLHHPLLDALLIGLILVGTYLSQTTGFIR